ncbi:CO(2)-response secreted protease-like [Aristolochia californica]|uniref:CO(2)-response secreted protease-like n=1 Tax=Aristolochia californica TaxID=171875 RepID=UPI0035D92289
MGALVLSSSSRAYLLPRILVFTVFYLCLHGRADQTTQTYVVYLGSATDSNGEDLDSAHLQMLSSILPSEERERLSLIHSYNHAFIGFSAMLTEEEANALSEKDGVVSVFRDPVLQLHTTRSWNFLEPKSERSLQGQGVSRQVSSDVIIGIIDTGIWPESPSFDDTGIGEIPSRWKGVCMEAPDFKKSACNRKLIGARSYNIRDDSLQPNAKQSKPIGSPRDEVGHGTHTASTAAGAVVHNASYYGLAAGTARGGSPSSRIAMYKACSLGGCSGSTILKAIDDAIKDGVDIISISIGISSIFQSDFISDPIAIGAFHASQKGVLVVCSGGNDGPDPLTVVNAAPWIFTVAASNIDRDFQSSIALGNGLVFRGTAINFANLTRSKTYPLGFGGDVAAKSVPLNEASNCYPGSLDLKKTAGRVVVCINNDPTVSRRTKKLVAETSGAKGMILIDDVEKGVAFDSGSFPFSEVGDTFGGEILKYIASNKNPTATILPTVAVEKFKPAPVVAYFSSRGPGALTETILKPDVMAPGINILAATVPGADAGEIPVGKKPSHFGIRSGTSMACPHVAGAAAFIKSQRPNWTSSMIKSALMTTATVTDNMRKQLTNSSAAYANPHEMGAGEISPYKALNPGLVYETTTQDYLNFLCYYGYKEKLVRSISGVIYGCPKKSMEDLIPTINYPSISIPRLDSRRPDMTIPRTLTNVGPSGRTYVVSLSDPSGLIAKVSPEKLVFSESMKRLSYKVTFAGKGAKRGYSFGTVTWSDGVHQVRTVFVANIV